MNNEIIVQLLDRKIKGLPMNNSELITLQNWLDASENNRKILESLQDETWLATAKERYFAPGKEAGRQQLQEVIFGDQQKPLTWWQRLKRFLR